MPAMMAAVFVIVLFVVWMISEAVRFMTAHLAVVVPAIALGVPLVLYAAWALLKGAERNTVITLHSRMVAPAPQRSLPAPVKDIEPAMAAPVREKEAFTAEQPEDPVILRCEGPDCAAELPEKPVAVEVGIEDPDTVDELHLFCGRACAKSWREADIRRRGIED